MSTRLYINVETRELRARVLSCLLNRTVTEGQILACDLIEQACKMDYDTRKLALSGVTNGEEIDYFNVFGLGRLTGDAHRTIEELGRDTDGGTVEPGFGAVVNILASQLPTEPFHRLSRDGLLNVIGLHWS